MLSSSSSSKMHNQIGSQSYRIITQYGDMLAIKQGIQHQTTGSNSTTNTSNQASSQQDQQHQQQQQSRPIIMTFHDLGLNSELQFASFCESDEVKLMLQTFTMIHVNFIGQEFSASTSGWLSNNSQQQQHPAAADAASNKLPDDFKYPSVEQMAESIVDVCTQLRVRSFIGLAVGAGAHIVSLLALMRPDLVDGLFLINPVVTSCSITEWLYFKMSAIASHHHLGGSSANASQHSHCSADASSKLSQPNHESSPPAAGENSPKRSHSHSQQHQPSSHHHHHSHSMGIRRLLNAAHIHLPHHHSPPPPPSSSSSLTLTSEPAELEQAAGEKQDADTYSIATQLSGCSSSSLGSANNTPASGGAKQPIGSRLRRLILSRNFRLGSHGEQLSRAGSTLSTCKPAESALLDSDERQPIGAREGSASCESILESPHRSGKRPPYEYLMYHHFGPASLQRYRRSSDTPAGAVRRPTSSGASSECDRASLGGDNESSGDNSSPASTSNSPRGRRGRPARRARGSASHSDDSLTSGTAKLAVANQRRQSAGLNLSANYLASISSDRQRVAYMQTVYKHHFAQVNSHNLWLFAQSFAKRRALNLRKDCGAAAHAAAAAATLGTSIYTAFIGLAAPGAMSGVGQASGSRPASAELGRTLESRTTDQRAESAGMATSTATSSSHSASAGQVSGQPKAASGSGKASASGSQHPQALVAGTKVKRTFTCQTLIMCSSLQMHCERAFKLMSLLNPLQATWIKTDHLLVLEERPDKVCQALRLFLQGIGYSMSTYERRLRLSSATGSAGSNDSAGSARSLSEKS